MIKLDIPLHLQKLHSEDCGPTCTLMVLDYFGITSDANEVLQKVPRCNFGTSTFDNAVVLLDYGLKVEMVMAQPLLFDGDFIRSKPSKQKIIARIKKVHDEETDQGKKDILTGLLTFINAGGTLTLAIPTKSIIETALDHGKPVMISTFTKTMGPDQGGYHFVVVGGYNDKQFLLFNPWQQSRQESWENSDEVLFGIHSSTLFDYDNGTILIVGKNS